MSSTIAIEEPRSIKDKMRNWYIEKFIDTGKAQTIEEAIDKKVEIEKKAIVVAGTVATIILLFVPADGPFGEICTALATPLLAKLVEIKGDIEKKVLIGGKRAVEANFLDVDGTNKEITLPDGNIVTNFVDLKNNAEKLSSEIGGRSK